MTVGNKTDQWSFLWNLSKKLKKAEVQSLLSLSYPLFRGQHVSRWSCFELFENLIESKKVKFSPERRAGDWCILKEWLESIHRKDLAKELDEFGNNFEDASVVFKDNFSKLQIECLLCENNFKLHKGKYSTHYDVAIKELSISSQQLNRSELILEKNAFNEHMDLVASFKHVNVLGFDELFEIMKERSPPCYVMEYYENRDLLHVLKKDKDIDTSLLIKYAKQIICGLKYLHENDVLHCNLKADNILLTNESVIKISGLSSARKLKKDPLVLELDENMKLAIKWMPLEAILHRRFCRASDVWSFGIVLVEMFDGGRLPYANLSNEETIRSLSKGERIKKPERCPDALYRSLMSKCWLLDPKERPTLASILSTLDNNSVDQRIQDVVPQILDLGNRRTIYITEKRASFLSSSRVLFLDSISPDKLTLTEEILGKGFHSVVHKGILLYENKNVEVAVKAFNPYSTTKKEFKNEIDIMKKLSHPNIVFMIGVCEYSDNDIYLVTELMGNGSLLQLLRESPEKLESQCQLVDVALQVCKGMEYLEKSNVIHRDLAARNILVGEDLKVFKISDFGMSVLKKGNARVEKAEKISFRWSAPEVISSQVHESKSDVWSYGILLVELFSYGECPYKEMNHQELEPKVLSGFKHSKPAFCPDSVYALMTKCWSMKPSERPSFDDIAKELNRIYSSITPNLYVMASP